MCVLWPNVSQIRGGAKRRRRSTLLRGRQSSFLKGADRNLQRCYNIWKEDELRDPWRKRAMFGKVWFPQPSFSHCIFYFLLFFFLQPTVCFVFFLHYKKKNQTTNPWLEIQMSKFHIYGPTSTQKRPARNQKTSQRRKLRVYMNV